jgi:hypothetical protein
VLPEVGEGVRFGAVAGHHLGRRLDRDVARAASNCGCGGVVVSTDTSGRSGLATTILPCPAPQRNHDAADRLGTPCRARVGVLVRAVLM